METTKRPMMYVGVDPDTRNCPIVALREGSDRIEVEILRVPKGLANVEATLEMCRQMHDHTVHWPAKVAVERMSMVQAKQRGANPQYICNLNLVAGAALAMFSDLRNVLICPLPSEWKGQVPKPINHSRTLRKLNMQPGHRTLEYTAPSVEDQSRFDLPDGFKLSDWKHVMDALGLALHAKASL